MLVTLPSLTIFTPLGALKANQLPFYIDFTFLSLWKCDPMMRSVDEKMFDGKHGINLDAGPGEPEFFFRATLG